ncbi:unnamed protein product [Linum tenue]|uniref:Peroxidase n=1 Tax=Linum tenue TaxID=586396 RepID=A0AAV0L9X0_9ROSI|nr:unnamed protein product [Linum tenue]
MASSSTTVFASVVGLALLLFVGSGSAQLNTNFYSKSCPQLQETIYRVVEAAVRREARMGASLLRLFFHDCFVNVSCAHIFLSILFKNANPNRNSARGFDVIDSIKSAVEKACPGTVSCADVLAVAARDSTVLLGGPSWNVKLGRRDARTASQSAANNGIPPPTSNLTRLVSRFNALGLSARDLVALSGSHTVGQARCTSFRARIYNERNTLDASLARTRQSNCPSRSGSGDNNLAPLDAQSPTTFDNSYFGNLVSRRGLLHSDQQLFSGGSTDSIVRSYSGSQGAFRSDFVSGMVKMGDISPLTGSQGEIRRNCRRPN